MKLLNEVIFLLVKEKLNLHNFSDINNRFLYENISSEHITVSILFYSHRIGYFNRIVDTLCH